MLSLNYVCFSGILCVLLLWYLGRVWLSSQGYNGIFRGLLQRVKEHLKGNKRAQRTSSLWSQKWTHTSVKMGWETWDPQKDRRRGKSMRRLRKCTAKQNSADWKAEEPSIGQGCRDAELRRYDRPLAWRNSAPWLQGSLRGRLLKLPPPVWW